MKILEILYDKQQASAPIELSIGHVSDSNQVQHGTLIIKSASPAVVSKLISAGYSLSVTAKGVQIFDYS